MVRKAVFSDRVPGGRAGQYSQAVIAGDLVCIAGTTGQDMTTGV
jgi:enamine deaminase RidA (YjgF/YER057c/UK114 family)